MRGMALGFLWLLAGPLSASTDAAEAAFREAVSKLPYQPGERLVYKVKWGIFTVGEVTLEVAGPAQIDGRLALHYTFSARTTGIAEQIFRVRDVVHSYFDPVEQEALLYLKEQQEGDDIRSIVVAFDHENGTATYSNFGVPKEPVAIPDGTHCPLSILYASRLVPHEGNRVTTVELTNGSRVMAIGFPVRREQDVQVGAGRFATHRIDAEISNGDGDFAEGSDSYARLWLTDDASRVPVMFETRLKAGTFRAKLESKEVLPQAADAWAAFTSGPTSRLDG